MSTRKFTDAEYDRIVELREAGKTHSQIAEALGCSKGTVAWTCLRLGATSPRGFRAHPSRSYQRKTGTVRPYDVEEDRRLLALEAEGLGYSEIGKKLGRRPNSIRGRLLTLARHDEQGAA